MSGFKKFIMQGNLVELAVAFVMAVAFGAVVKSFVDVIMSLIGKIGGQPNFNDWKPWDLPLGAFVTTVVAFVILAAVVYFAVVKPYEAVKARSSTPEEEATGAEITLLTEIRDSLRARS